MKNGSSVYFVVAFLIFLVSGVVIHQFRSTRDKKAPEFEAASEQTETTVSAAFLGEDEYPTFVTGAMEPGNIRLELKPEGFENGVLSIRFFASAHDLVLDSYDLGSMVTLEYKGRKIRPERADRVKGHHGSGLMTFRVGEELGEFSVTVEGLPGEELRVFTW